MGWSGPSCTAPCGAVTSGRVKIFNSFKSLQWDMQIGDRRERHAWEARIPGPSAHLPLGTMIGCLAVPAGMGLKTCVTDRQLVRSAADQTLFGHPCPCRSFLKPRHIMIMTMLRGRREGGLWIAQCMVISCLVTDRQI